MKSILSTGLLLLFFSLSGCGGALPDLSTNLTGGSGGGDGTTDDGSGGSGSSDGVIDTGSTSENPSTELLQPADFEYLGAFKLPEIYDGTGNNRTFAYSNAPLAYYPDGDSTGSADGYAGSLFIAGHLYSSHMAEVKIPAPVISAAKRASDLPQTTLIQNFSNVLSPVSNKEGFILGMVYLPKQGSQTTGKIYFNVSTDYSADLANPKPTLGWFDVTLGTPNTGGTWFLGNEQPFNTGKYLMEVPKAWADANAPGYLLATGRHRNSFGDAEGPNLYLTRPWDEGNPPARSARLAQYKKLAQYYGPGDAQKRWAKDFAGSDDYQGSAWLTAGTKGAVAIVGIKELDVNKAYYGYENWKTPDQCEPSGTCQGQRGWRCGNGRGSILLYDPADYAKVLRGELQPHQVQWYARVDINDKLFNPITPTFLSTGSDSFGTTFDRAHGLLYISEQGVWGDSQPIVHVWKVKQ